MTGTFSFHEAHIHKLLTTAWCFANLYLSPKEGTKPPWSSRADFTTQMISRGRRHLGNWQRAGVGCVLDSLLPSAASRISHLGKHTDTQIHPPPAPAQPAPQPPPLPTERSVHLGSKQSSSHGYLGCIHMQVQTLLQREAAVARAHAVAAGMLLRPYHTVTPVHQEYSSAVTGRAGRSPECMGQKTALLAGSLGWWK